jgi:hypothetical protein
MSKFFLLPFFLLLASTACAAGSWSTSERDQVRDVCLNNWGGTRSHCECVVDATEAAYPDVRDFFRSTAPSNELLTNLASCEAGSSSDAMGATDTSTPAKTPTNASAAGQSTHIFQSGDTLWSLAARYLGDGNRWPEIVQLNGIGDPNAISNGTPILIPGGALTATQRAPETTRAATTAVCTADQSNTLANAVSTRARDFRESEPPSRIEEMSNYQVEQQSQLSLLATAVDEWGRCLRSAGAPSSHLEYHEAYAEWIAAEELIIQLAIDCYRSDSDPISCITDISTGPAGLRLFEAMQDLSEVRG